MTNTIKHNFYPGDEWLYYKIYCGENTTDKILIETIQPLVSFLLENKFIEKWFFIRYSDPEHHLRIRFLVTDVLHIRTILKQMNTQLKKYTESKEIWNIQIDTYQREIKRYGATTVEIAESFFYRDSEFILQLLHNTTNDTDKLNTILYYINHIIDCFKFSLQYKISFIEKMRTSYKEEFYANKQSMKIISKKYQSIEKSVDLDFSNIKIKNILDRFFVVKNQDNLEVNLSQLLSSLIHMTINRLFSSKQRLYELVLYDFLLKLNQKNLYRK
ncbi:thiopeptide-type bacteriocin biosynthesis protein [Tenacibaculum agarivorans]|uniref:thiopeptide-type bacteriocin biosynthesis protein n=1 Tax=Tenacibaculum agarivorans TaxID=1908389 RepID=UPI00094B7B30|nr:thiopeptide-type bacteriocin biosynthesis protein [Tenacibaculum agarivorans]